MGPEETVSNLRRTDFSHQEASPLTKVQTVNCLENGSVNKHLQDSVSSKLNIKKQCVLATKKFNSMLGCINRSIATRSSKATVSL